MTEIRRSPHESNREKVLNILEAITLYGKNTRSLIHESVSFKIYSEDLIKNIIEYVSWIIALYKILKPKISKISTTTNKFTRLLQIDYYDRSFINFDLENFGVLFKIFQIFNDFEDLLRELCEEYGYTIDKPLEVIER